MLGCRPRPAVPARTMLVVGAWTLGLAGPAAAKDAVHTFRIPAQSAAGSLEAFAQQTGKQVLFPYDATAGRQAPAISGTLQDDEVLRRLAGAAGLVVGSNDGKTITLQRRPAAQTAGAPPAPPPTLEQANTIAEVIVTAQKRQERMQNVPIAITAMGAGQLEAEGVSNVMDLDTVVPGLNYNRAVGIYGLPVIRGIGTTSQGPGIENPVATYIDGVYIFGTAGTVIGLHDIDQVAVLKGPQGTLFGRNATGGLIQVTTKSPTQEPQLDGDVTVGNLGGSEESLYASGGLNDRLAANLALSYGAQDQGFGRNLYNGQWLFTRRDAGARGKLLWRPDADTDVTLSADWSDSTAAEPVNRVLGNTVLGKPMPGGPFDTDLDLQPLAAVEAGGASLTAKRDFGAVQLVSISAYRYDRVHTRFDADGTTTVLQENEAQSRDAQVTQEVQLLSRAAGRLNWVAGLFFLGADTRSTAKSTNTATTYVVGDLGLTSAAAFGQATLRVDDATNLTGGVRYTHDDRTDRASRYPTTPGGTPTAGADAAANFGDPSWRLAIDHRLSPDLLAYASYDHGFRSGLFGASVPAIVLQPELLDAYEAGVKSDLLDRRLRINAAAYYYVDHDRKVLQIIAGQQMIFDARAAILYGVDADLTWVAGHGLSFNAGVSAEHARYTDYPNSALTMPLASGGNAIVVGSATGHAVESTPGFTLNIGPAYRVTTGLGQVDAAFNLYHNSGWFSAPDNRVRQGAYDTLAAEIAWRPAFAPHLSLRLWGRNLTNTAYAEQFTETSLSDNYQVAPGRTFGLTLGAHF